MVWIFFLPTCFERNPSIPFTLIDQPPTVEGTSNSNSFYKHINILHTATQAFTEAETSDKVWHALRTKLQNNSALFKQVDRVFHKRANSNQWKRPGVVIGQDSKVILIWHGSVYIHVSQHNYYFQGTNLRNMIKKHSSWINKSKL